MKSLYCVLGLLLGVAGTLTFDDVFNRNKESLIISALNEPEGVIEVQEAVDVDTADDIIILSKAKGYIQLDISHLASPACPEPILYLGPNRVALCRIEEDTVIVVFASGNSSQTAPKSL